MLKTLAIGSFLIGAVIAGCAAAYYFLTIDTLESDRFETESNIKKLEDSLAILETVSKLTDDFAESIGVTQNSDETKKDSKQQMAHHNAIKVQNENLQRINLRMRSTKRGSLIGVAVGLFFCLIQAPFLLVAGKQS